MIKLYYYYVQSAYRQINMKLHIVTYVQYCFRWYNHLN
jgi:hypothetical protein